MIVLETHLNYTQENCEWPYSHRFLSLTGYVGAATVGGAIWWFLYDETGPGVTYYQLVGVSLLLLSLPHEHKHSHTDAI